MGGRVEERGTGVEEEMVPVKENCENDGVVSRPHTHSEQRVGGTEANTFSLITSISYSRSRQMH